MEGQFLYNKFETIDKRDEPILFIKKNRYKVNLKTQYRKNKEFEEKIQATAENDKAKAADLKINRIWESTMSRIKGEKVKDNNKLIEKTFKNKRKLKERQSKKWSERKFAQNLTQKKAADKRKANIEKRKNDKLSNKVKKLKKKGRLITGLN